MQAICSQTWVIKYCRLMPPAAAGGHISILKHLRSGSVPTYWESYVTAAAAPHLDWLKWLVSADAPGGPCPCSGSILSKIAEHHGLSALQWCRKDSTLPKYVWNWEVSWTAANMGDQAMLQWLRSQEPPVPWNELVCAKAAEHGNISMLRWLRGQNLPCPRDVTAIAAAASSDVKTLQWLRGQHPPCPWDASSCVAAARAGKLESLIWLRAQDPPCPWSIAIWEAAADQPNVEILEWLHEHGCPLAEYMICPCATAARSGHLAVLQWLWRHGDRLNGACSHMQQHPCPEVSAQDGGPPA